MWEWSDIVLRQLVEKTINKDSKLLSTTKLDNTVCNHQECLVWWSAEACPKIEIAQTLSKFSRREVTCSNGMLWKANVHQHMFVHLICTWGLQLPSNNSDSHSGTLLEVVEAHCCIQLAVCGSASGNTCTGRTRQWCVMHRIIAMRPCGPFSSYMFRLQFALYNNWLILSIKYIQHFPSNPHASLTRQMFKYTTGEKRTSVDFRQVHMSTADQIAQQLIMTFALHYLSRPLGGSFASINDIG